MSSLEDRKAEMEVSKMSEKTKTALASIDATERKRAAAGYAVIGGAMAYGEGSLGDGVFGKISFAAKWFCIWFAMIAPVLLFWRVAL
ncbi:hypothetical protein C8N43_3630 [Litoreibacter ponti]|uniref:Uncharacterized protein n=1 Tax=Litoreibacter ponti TaxID=1510457 RepID=A0A2T6BFI2_9RHOB|nr:hypothetical protein [Litoreibacter ponti]PTX54809.1 hypothetical protein C8N43_3630 [Litoreibacter ponti]